WGPHARNPTGKARGEQARRLQHDAPPVEQLAPGRPARRGGLQHGMRGEKGREHHDVAENKDPEAEADDYALGGRAAFPVTRCIDVPNANAARAEPITAVPEPVR